MVKMVEITKAIKQWLAPKPSVLSDILRSPSAREELLGMQSVVPPSQDQILHDANKIVSYSSKQDYQVWATEAWAKALSHLDSIQNPKATMDEVNFHRGALSATLNLLRVSEQARSIKTQLEQDEKPFVSSARK